jgi:biopolymer transport protein TolR
MAMNVGGKKGGLMGDINVTPLVDVVLVLLIIFMVVTPMLSSGVDVKLPKAKNTESTQDVGQNLVVSIRNDGAVFVDTKRSSNETLVDDINTAYRSDPSRSPPREGGPRAQVEAGQGDHGHHQRRRDAHDAARRREEEGALMFLFGVR